jgi:hypothetical protein
MQAGMAAAPARCGPSKPETPQIRDTDAMTDAYDLPRRRRRWPIVLTVLLVAIGGVWAVGWHYAAGRVAETVEAWKVREARAGRVYACASQEVVGFPFAIRVRCPDAGAQFKSLQPPLSLQARDLTVSAQLWQPTVLIADVTGPLAIRDHGASDGVVAHWSSAQATVHGLPATPERLDIALEEPTFDRATGTQAQRLIQARRMDLRGTMIEGTAFANPVIQIAATLIGASAPGVHPAAALPVDSDSVIVLRGLKDFAPKPWSVRFRELQAAGGRIQIVRARLQQGESIAVAQGELGLSPAGRLDGQVQLVVANLEKLLPALGLDKALPPTANNPMNSAFGALDRLAPGLGNIARQNAGPALAVGLNFLGRPTELEGKRAVAIPLRFSDGVASLGPIQLGSVPALY